MPPNVLKVFSLHICLCSALQLCGLKLPLPQALNSTYHEVMMQKTFAGASIHCKWRISSNSHIKITQVKTTIKPWLQKYEMSNIMTNCVALFWVNMHYLELAPSLVSYRNKPLCTWVTWPRRKPSWRTDNACSRVPERDGQTDDGRTGSFAMANTHCTNVLHV